VRPIAEYPGFYIAKDGEVFSTVRGNGVIKRKYSFTREGYKRITLTQDGNALRLHREVLKAFDRPPKEGEICRHLDGNPGNNHISNLKWGTTKENAQDCLKHRRNKFQILVGENSPTAKFSDIEIEDIRTRRKEGATYKEIMEVYDISKSHVSYIINRKTRVRT